MKGQNVPKPGIPESFKVLIKELQSIGLDLAVFDRDNNEVDLKRDFDEEDDMGIFIEKDIIGSEVMTEEDESKCAIEEADEFDDEIEDDQDFDFDDDEYDDEYDEEIEEETDEYEEL